MGPAVASPDLLDAGFGELSLRLGSRSGRTYDVHVELEQDPDNLTGQKLEWSGPPEFEPTLVTNSALPPWVQEEPARLQAIMEDLAMQHEVTNAGVPGRVDSGSAIQLLQESDDSVMKDTIHSLEEAV